jgi:hypothetical protein
VIQQDDLIYVTGAEIDAARTARKGWTRRQLARWGVAWPPQKGWRIGLQNGRRPDKGTEKLPRLSRREQKRHADDQQREKDGGKLKRRATEEHAQDVCKVCGKPASITITQGIKPNGALNVMWFCSRACAGTVAVATMTHILN